MHESHNTDQIIEKTIVQIFENMYFMFPQRTAYSPNRFAFPMKCYLAQTQFINDKHAFRLIAAENLVSKMAMNFLGEKRPFEYTELIDIFREAANVIVGNFISASHMPVDVRFDIPEVTPLAIAAYEADHSYEVDQMYVIENNFFRIALFGRH